MENPASKGVAFVCVKDSNVYRLRVKPVADLLGCRVFDPQRLPSKRIDTIVLVKRALGMEGRIRGQCRRLIFDPLDCWRFKEGFYQKERDFWRGVQRDVRFDELILTTPSALESAIKQCGITRFHLVPHAHDPRLSRDWYDPKGPVIYYGWPEFVVRSLWRFHRYFRDRGTQFLVYDSALFPLEVIRGASAHVCVRMSPYDYGLNRIAKPQIKIENAIAAGAKVIAINHKCVTSHRKRLVTVKLNSMKHKNTFRDSVDRVLEQGFLSNPYSPGMMAGDYVKAIFANVATISDWSRQHSRIESDER